jgi:hypothetical protein
MGIEPATILLHNYPKARAFTLIVSCLLQLTVELAVQQFQQEIGNISEVRPPPLRAA